MWTRKAYFGSVCLVVHPFQRRRRSQHQAIKPVIRGWIYFLEVMLVATSSLSPCWFNWRRTQVHSRAFSRVNFKVIEDWLTNNFVSAVEWYCASKVLPFKVLLVLDNAPGYPLQLNDMHPNGKVVYLLANTTSLLQPTGQGVNASFEAYCLCRIWLWWTSGNPTASMKLWRTLHMLGMR